MQLSESAGQSSRIPEGQTAWPKQASLLLRAAPSNAQYSKAIGLQPLHWGCFHDLGLTTLPVV